MPPKTFIVITTIYAPSKAVSLFASMPGYELVVVGDTKTPEGWNHPNCTYLSLAKQYELFPELANMLPLNSYSRKMLGYAYAIKNGADIIIDTDDDNIPYRDWEFPEFSGLHATTAPALGWVNVYNYFTPPHRNVWPRGLPLRNILDDRDKLKVLRDPQQNEIGVWQGLANGDPDVDAIYRLTSNEPVRFFNFNPLVLNEKTVSPFNSQNTAFRKELFPLLFLPTSVTFRFTDILRSVVAQPIMWANGYKLGFTKATVEQQRNPHDYVSDFESEVPMYLHTESALQSAIDYPTLKDCYLDLYKKGIVKVDEIVVLNEWIKLFV